MLVRVRDPEREEIHVELLTLPTDRCFVIAEAGTNHAHANYDDRFKDAMTYVLRAKEAKADAIKFQWFNDAKECDFFCPLPGDEQRWPRWRDSVLHPDDWIQVKRFAEACGLVFLASTFQHTTVAWLNELGVVATKVASRAAMGFPYGMSPEPYLISLGMEVPKILPFEIVYLQCEAKYPSTRIWNDYDDGEGRATHEGFSDHSGTPWRAIDAISRGCRIVEVHYHLDERDAGPDLPASLTLDELKLVCEARDAFADLRSR